MQGLKKDLHERVEAQVNKHAADNTTTRKEIQHLQQDFKIVNDMLSTNTQKQVELPNLNSKFDSLNQIVETLSRELGSVKNLQTISHKNSESIIEL